jgi:hypothetical protein
MHTRQAVHAVLSRPAAPLRPSLKCSAKQQQKDSQTTEQRGKQAPSSLNAKQGTIQPQEEQVPLTAC